MKTLIGLIAVAVVAGILVLLAEQFFFVGRNDQPIADVRAQVQGHAVTLPDDMPGLTNNEPILLELYMFPREESTSGDSVHSKDTFKSTARSAAAITMSVLSEIQSFLEIKLHNEGTLQAESVTVILPFPGLVKIRRDDDEIDYQGMINPFSDAGEVKMISLETIQPGEEVTILFWSKYKMDSFSREQLEIRHSQGQRKIRIKHN